MSLRTVKVRPNRQLSGLVSDPGPWVRNPSWLAVTEPSESEDKCVLLYAVEEHSNYVALSASGNYTVNWGDGDTENFSAGVQANHLYSFSDGDLANTNAPCTFTASGSTVDRTAHGYANGMFVSLFNIVTTTGISNNTPYYVVNATANTFQVSATLGGSPLTLTGNGSGTLLPHKQAIITITPQGGQQITALNLHLRHTSINAAVVSVIPYLELAASLPNVTDMRMGRLLPSGGTSVVSPTAQLEQISLYAPVLRQLGSLFQNGFRLQSIKKLSFSTAAATSHASITMTVAGSLCTLNSHPFVNGETVVFTALTGVTAPVVGTAYFIIGATANTFQISTTFGGSALTFTGSNGSGTAVRGVSLGSLFNSCRRLAVVSLFNTAAVTNMSSMFNNCSSLREVPLFNTAAVVNMNLMFFACNTIREVPLFNTAAVTNMDSMFQNCTAIREVPLFNTASVTTMANMFVGSTSILKPPLFNTVLVTNMSGMFQSCTAIREVPLFNTASVTTMANMFQNCTAIREVPLFNTASVTTMVSIFSGCSSLHEVPLFNTAAVTTMASMFQSCSSLVVVPALDCGAVTSGNFSNMFLSCFSLSKISATNFKFTFTVANCNLSGAALDALYTNLPTVSSQTITVTNNVGTATDDPSIATAKGWTVTGS